jgi:hypothetical protein
VKYERIDDVRNPFIAGSWVRGENFFGRAELLREILEGRRDSLWVAGARRLGKTSLLKELEYRVQQAGDTPFVPLYWDLQGSAGRARAGRRPAGQRRGRRGLPEGHVDRRRGPRRAVRGGDAHDAGPPDRAERMALAAAGGRGGGVPHAGAQRPRTDPPPAAVFQKGPEVRTVLTSTKRLARIDERTDFATSPFLQGFSPPVYLTPLAPDEVRALLARGRFAEEDVVLILARTASHPFLVQLIASRLFESRDLAATLDQVAADEMIANFFSVDFQTLDPLERLILEEVAREGSRTATDLAQATALGDEALEPVLFGLRMMGYLAFDGSGCRIGNWFFERWLRRVGAARADAVRPA